MILRFPIFGRHAAIGLACSLALVAALLCATPARAQTQAEMTMHATALYRAANAEMDERYQALRNRLSPEAKALLEISQRDWMKFRTSECTFRSSAVVGGSAYRMVVAYCMQTLTEARSEELQRIMDCDTDDMSCPF